MLLNAFKLLADIDITGLQLAYQYVYLPIQGRLFTHSRTFIYPFKDVYLPNNDL